MSTPLYQTLIEYSKKYTPFHMPGHKFGKFGNMKELDLLALDATEASGLDNLYVAEGIIKEAMDALSRFYKSKDTIMLTNGSTAGILASLLSVCKEGEGLIVARNCHHSVWHGLVLAGAQPVYITPEYDEDKNLMTRINPESVKAVLKQYPHVKGMIMVSPTYEGITSDIQEIADILHEQEKILIVDEAHGAHFEIDEYFPKSALQLGADIVIHSMHKTLPTLTQSALLHIGSHRIEKEEVIKALRMVQTSSPSYMMMGVMDYIRAYIEQHHKQIQQDYIVPLQEARKKLQSMTVLKVIEDTKNPYDYSKIIISTENSEIDGYQLAEQLEQSFNITCEAASTQQIILMTTMADDYKSLQNLVKALIDIDGTLNQIHMKENQVPYSIFKQSIKSETISCRKTYYGKHLSMPINKCEDKICVENIMMYPPGIPIVCIGERITIEHIKQIKQWAHKLQGIQYNNNEIICKILADEV